MNTTMVPNDDIIATFDRHTPYNQLRWVMSYIFTPEQRRRLIWLAWRYDNDKLTGDDYRYWDDEASC